jgi:protein-disulfide isomerase
MGRRQQGETSSKRQTRKEELRKKQRQQRTITLGALGIGALLLLAVIIIPSVQRAANPAGDFVKITPVAYENADGTKLGDPNVKAKIEVFEDFQCDACKTYVDDVQESVIERIVKPGLAYYEFRQYPFLDDRNTIKDSDRSALAAECAAEQNLFWDYAHILFANQTGITGQFSDVRLTAYAKSIGMQVDQFETCLAEAKYQSKVDADLKLGTEMGVGGTPSVFVNGQEVSPGQVPSFDQIYQLVMQAQQ